MTPIKSGTAKRLGLRKPTGTYVYRDGSVRDEIRLFAPITLTGNEEVIQARVRDFAKAVGVTLDPWQEMVLAKTLHRL